MQSQQSQAKKQTEAQIARIEREILAGYQQAQKDITKEIGDFYLDVLDGVDGADYYNVAIKRDRFAALEAAVTKRYSQASVAAGLGTRESSALGMSNVYYKNEYISSFFAPIKDVGISFNALPPSILEMVVSGTTNKWEAIPKVSQDEIIRLFGTIDNYLASSGSTLTSLLSANRASEIVAIRRNLASGIIRGAPFKETAQAVADVIGKVTPKGASGAMASSLRIVRTESIRAMNAGAYANSQAVEEQGLDIERIWVASLDDRTRVTHQRLDGQQVKVDEPFQGSNGTAMYPGDFGVASEDINCRCTTVDAVDGIPPTARRGVNPETGEYEIYDWQNYDEWKKSNGVRTLPSGREVAPSTPIKIMPKDITTANKQAIDSITGLKKVDYKGLEPEVANNITESIVNMQNKYGPLGIDEIKMSEAKSFTMAARVDDVPGVGGHTTLKINRKVLQGDLEGVNRRINWDSANPFDVARDLNEVTIHEVGHFLTYRGKTPAQISKEMLALSDMHIGEEISKYATTHGAEALSEAFVLINRGEPVATDIRWMMDKYMGKGIS